MNPDWSTPIGRRAWVVVAIVGAVVAALGAAQLGEMFLDGHLGYAGALRGTIGRNYLHQDLIDTRFAPLQNGGPTSDAPPSVRYNHPPLSGMLVGLTFGVFGPSEAAARLVPLAASVLTVPLLFGWVRRIWGVPVALAAVGIWAVSPFVAIYATMVSYEPLVLLWWSLLLWAWSRWHLGEAPRRDLIWAGLAIFLGVWTDWPMVPLAGGLAACELTLVIARRPRRPAMLLVTSLTLIGALGALALYYLAILDVASSGLESLYRMRSTVGRWSPADVAVHIAHRTAVLLTWPVVIAAAVGFFGLIAGRPRLEAPLSGRGRILLPLGLLAPPLTLLVGLPQHAVIHCFSAWYLLPGAAVAAGAVLVWLIRWLGGRFNRLLAVTPAVLFGALVTWGALPVVADGWISDGSPLEGRPRLRYEHLVVARWAGEVTEPGDILVVSPATGVVGVRAWFQHGRPVRRLRSRGPLVRTMRSSGAKLALLPRGRVGGPALAPLIEEAGLVIIDRVVALDLRRPGDIRVLELREDPPSPWWIYAHSACYPPHRLVPAPGRTAAYRSQLLGDRVDEPSWQVSEHTSLTELAARHLLARGGPKAARLEGAIRERLGFSQDDEVCPGLWWAGGQTGATEMGRGVVRLVFRAERDLPRLPTIRARLRPLGPGRAFRWTVEADDLLEWPAESWIVSSEGLPPELPAGRYRLELRACGRRVERLVELNHRPVLPVMEPVGRL